MPKCNVYGKVFEVRRSRRHKRAVKRDRKTGPRRAVYEWRRKEGKVKKREKKQVREEHGLVEDLHKNADVPAAGSGSDSDDHLLDLDSSSDDSDAPEGGI